MYVEPWLLSEVCDLKVKILNICIIAITSINDYKVFMGKEVSLMGFPDLESM